MARSPSRIIGVVALMLMLAACGGGEGSTTTIAVAGDADASITAAVVAALASDAATGLFSNESAQCVAQGLIDKIGVERMVFLTVASADAAAGDPTAIFGRMTADEVALAMTAVEGCVELQSVVVAYLTLSGVTADGASCVGGALVQGGFGEPIAEALLTGSDPTGDTGFAAAWVDAFARQCPGATHQLLVDNFTSYGVGAESATCVADAFVEGGSLPGIVTVMMGITDSSVDTTAINDYMTQVLTGCLTPDELTIMGITTTTTTQP